MSETLLKHLARERGLRQYSRFRAEFQDAARRRGLGSMSVSARTFERWIAGETLPRPGARETLEEMFGQSIEELLSYVGEPAEVTPAAVLPPDGVIDSVAPAVDEWRSTASQQDLGSGPQMNIWTILAAAADDSLRHAAEAEQTLGAFSMQQLENAVTRHARDFFTRSPLFLLPEIVATRKQVWTKLQETRRPDQLRDLNFMAGVLCGLLAEVSVSMGQHRAAGDHALAAWTYADTIGHAGLAAWSRGMQSSAAWWDQRPREALLAVRRGEEYVTTGRSAARLHGISARAWSHTGNVSRTLQAVHAAEQAHEHGGESADDLHDVIGGVFRWTAVRQELCASTALLHIVTRLTGADTADVRRLTTDAANHARHALALSRAEPEETRWLALELSAALDMAAACLLQGDLRGAQDVMKPVFALPVDQRTFPLLFRVDKVRSQLAGSASRTAHELVEQAADFVATATLRALPASP